MSRGPRHASLGVWLLLALSLAIVPSGASAQQQADVDIDMNGVVILHYFSQLNLTIPAATVTAWLNATADQGARADSLSNTGVTLGRDVDIVNNGADMTVDPRGNRVVMHLNNVWAVRSINNSGSQTQVAIAKSAGTVRLVHAVDNSKRIVVRNTRIRTSGGSWGTSTAFGPTGLFNPIVGDVRLRLNFNRATLAGTYSVAGAGAVYTLTATNL